VLIELFSLDVTAGTLRAKRDRKSAISLQRGQFDPKFQVEGIGRFAFLSPFGGLRGNVR